MNQDLQSFNGSQKSFINDTFAKTSAQYEGRDGSDERPGMGGNLKMKLNQDSMSIFNHNPNMEEKG